MIPSAGLAENELYKGSSQDTHPEGRGNRNRETPPPGKSTGSGGAVVTGNGISYHGGPVMHGTVNVYYIWYGDWTKDPGANQILTNWANTIGGSPYQNITTTYGDTTGNVSGAIALSVKSTSMASSTFGTSLSDSSIASIVSKALSTGALPTDSNGVYFVLTAPDIAETSGFLSQYCGWHTYGNINGLNIKYAFVGNAAASLGSCAIQTGSSPNNDPAADAMVSVMSHELEESISDPNLNAWYDSNGEESADKCAWTFGTYLWVHRRQHRQHEARWSRLPDSTELGECEAAVIALFPMPLRRISVCRSRPLRKRCLQLGALPEITPLARPLRAALPEP